MEILFVTYGGMGDVLVDSCIAENIKRNFPKCNLTLVVYGYTNFNPYANNPFVDTHVVITNPHQEDEAKSLFGKYFDKVFINCHYQSGWRILERLNYGELYGGYSFDKQYILTQISEKFCRAIQECEKKGWIYPKWNMKWFSTRPEIYVSDEDMMFAKNNLSDQKKNVILGLTSSGADRSPPVHMWEAFATQNKGKYNLIGVTLSKLINIIYPSHYLDKYLRIIYDCSLPQFAALVDIADYVVMPHSGSIVLCNMCSTPTVVLNYKIHGEWNNNFSPMKYMNLDDLGKFTFDKFEELVKEFEQTPKLKHYKWR